MPINDGRPCWKLKYRNSTELHKTVQPTRKENRTAAAAQPLGQLTADRARTARCPHWRATWCTCHTIESEDGIFDTRVDLLLCCTSFANRPAMESDGRLRREYLPLGRDSSQ